jgi:hypothetical protein
MAVIYSQNAINYRLNGVISAIGSGGSNGALKLLTSGGQVLSTITLANPCGTVNGGVLTFTTPLLDPSAATTGSAAGAVIYDSNGNVQVSGLVVGIPLSGADIIISNGLNSTVITAGEVVDLLSAQITGS